MGRLGEFFNRMSTCAECRCGVENGWRKDCGCTRYDCECSATAGPDTDGDDTFEYQRPGGPAEPVKGKWWLGGRCSMACGDMECPPCQREELHKADQLPPTSFPWLNGAPVHEPHQPPAKPGIPRPAAAPTTSSSGATMTSADTYSGLRARIIGVASRAPERQGPLQQALQGVEEDIAELNSISEDSSQTGIQEALGSLMRAKESIEEANWMVGAAQASTEGAAAGLQ